MNKKGDYDKIRKREKNLTQYIHKACIKEIIVKMSQKHYSSSKNVKYLPLSKVNFVIRPFAVSPVHSQLRILISEMLL